MTKKPNFLCLCLLFLVTVNFTQCSRNNNQNKSDASTLSILYSDTGLFNPCIYLQTRMLMFDSLLEMDIDGNMVGRLAENWEHSPDLRTWKIKLNEAAYWHDGMPITSHDVKFTFDLLSHPDVHQLLPKNFSINIINDKEFSITFHGSPYYSPLDTESIYFPKHLLENLDPKEFCKWPFWEEPVGSGPYRFVRRIPETLVELEANLDYYLGKPKLSRLHLKYGGTTALTELLAGNVDVAMSVSEMELLKLQKNPRFKVYYNLGSPVAIFWNHKNKKFSDAKVRKALTLAINRKELFGLLNLPGESLVFDVPFTKRQYIHGELPKPLPFDLDEAKRLLDSAGWKDEDGDGIREKGGNEFQFTAIARGSNKSAVYVQDQLKRIGIRMEIKSLNNYNVRLKFREADFEAIFYVFKPRIQGKLFGDDYPPMGYVNTQVVNLFKRALDTWGDEEEEDAFKELWPIFERDIPVTFLYLNIWTHVAHKRLKGLQSPQRANPILDIEHLWIEEEK